MVHLLHCSSTMQSACTLGAPQSSRDVSVQLCSHVGLQSQDHVQQIMRDVSVHECTRTLRHHVMVHTFTCWILLQVTAFYHGSVLINTVRRQIRLGAF